MIFQRDFSDFSVALFCTVAPYSQKAAAAVHFTAIEVVTSLNPPIRRD